MKSSVFIEPPMCQIASGTFIMGSNDNRTKKHAVFLSAFEIAQYPVTFAEYDLFCDATGREYPNDETWGRGRRPVIHVSWQDAWDYSRWLSQNSKKMYRLPTEAEWEYACRAGSMTGWCCGTVEHLSDYAWFEQHGGNHTQTVGQKLPNAWGLYDMHGNVWEWTVDWYSAYPWDGSHGAIQIHPYHNPFAPESGVIRAVRGGSYSSEAVGCQSGFRAYSLPKYDFAQLGFRLVRLGVNSDSVR
ncbi:MAG: formylglycine-generating enzyme family protein [Pseudomonadota bacterium]